tara:strand:- start:531 stop:995 length:465 start_codon:yes stop_codon:yes gene_type:complete
MKKILIFYILFLFTSGCGYTSLYKNNDIKNILLNFDIIEATGDNDVNKSIINSLKYYSDDNVTKLIPIKIDSSYSKSSISKDKKGKTTAYAIVVTTNFNLIKKDEDTKKIIITEKININNIDDVYELKNYELKIKKDISRSIVRQFVERMHLKK